ncbi:discoidin domain-containing protein [Thioalkalicoccus limnaeus]|uniref:Discoidin domain-containing protein n=1 Tax=Thioalkalicoccus limnaeus TaxID=120681 RepID=A0ABV4B922_9GAMM
MSAKILFDLGHPAHWQAIAPGDAELALSAEAGRGGLVLRLDFDFHGGGGFVVARKPCALTLPDDFAIEAELRGIGPPNTLELKLVDPTNANVWRFQQADFALDPTWHTLRIPASRIDYAWGPAGGGAPREIGAIEVALVAGSGGRGSLWISALRLLDPGPPLPVLASASSESPGHEAARVLDGRPDTGWRAAAGDPASWLRIDFQGPREFGGLALRWEEPWRPRAFVVEASDDGMDWRVLTQVESGLGEINQVRVPEGCARLLRLRLSAPDRGEPIALISLEVLSRRVAKSVNEWFHGLAERVPRGHYPRWLYREQTYWTTFATPRGPVPALLNEDGMVEIEPAAFSIEPFIYRDGALIGWADCVTTPSLARGDLPIPSVTWELDDLTLTITGFAAGSGQVARPVIRYRLRNHTQQPRTPRLFLAVRPFQVCPPWQANGAVGGVSPVRQIACRGATIWVNDDLALLVNPPPDAAGVATYDQGPISDHLARGAPPTATEANDRFGFASAALAFDLALAPGGEAEVLLTWRPDEARFPLPEQPAAVLLAAAEAHWAATLDVVGLELPPPAQTAARVCRSAIAHILINRDGVALQPGPRRYRRAWIRDGAVMAAALLRWGRPAEAGAFVRWYADLQRTDGNVPCCVDHQGIDWLPEHDSHGQLIFTIAEHLRFTGDLEFADALWPVVDRAVGYLERLRAQRLSAAYRVPERRTRFGLLPESASHEGYLAQPVHAYWDDFWALRGFKDAAWLAEALGRNDQSARLAELRDDFRTTLLSSLRRTMTERAIDYLPGSVEWADPDPAAVANALTLIDEAHHLPAAALHRTFDRFLERFRAMHQGGADWTNYTPYEIRILGALVRLGRREEAHELLDFYLAERRPPAWNQWPEIAWRNPRAPGHQGDLPHSWIGAEYALAFRDLFVHERDADAALVVAAGVPEHWLAGGELRLTGMPTAHGVLDMELARRPAGDLRLRLHGRLRMPPGGIRFAPPPADQPRTIRANGVVMPDAGTPEILISRIPAEITLSAHG